MRPDTVVDRHLLQESFHQVGFIWIRPVPIDPLNDVVQNLVAALPEKIISTIHKLKITFYLLETDCKMRPDTLKIIFSRFITL